MIKQIFILLTIPVFLYSCVSQSEHDRVVSEKEAITQERDKLKQELEDIKFGAPNLLADGKRFYEAKDFSQARQKFQTLLEKHSEMSESIEAKIYLSNIDEEELWNRANTLDDISYSENYITKYPNGKYAVKAITRRNDLKILNMQKS